MLYVVRNKDRIDRLCMHGDHRIHDANGESRSFKVGPRLEGHPLTP